MTLAMKQRTICLLLVLIVNCVNKSNGSNSGGWSKSFSSSSASSSASAYSSSSSFSSGPIDLKQIQLPVATAFASANADAHLGLGGTSANAGASASAGAGANTGSQVASVAHAKTSSNGASGSLSHTGSFIAPASSSAGSFSNSGSHDVGVTNINNNQEIDKYDSHTTSDGAILTNVIAGAYAPSNDKGNLVKPNEKTKSGYYSHDFVLPSRDTESDYDSSEELGTQKSSSIGSTSTSSTSTTAGSYGSSKTPSTIGTTPSQNELRVPGQDLSGSITTNPHLKIPVAPTIKYTFPGPSGSIYDFKPAPPGGGGPDKAWLVTPIATGSYGGAKASSDASSFAGSTGLNYKLISDFPGASGSIYDSKPASSVPVNPSHSAGCSSGSCMPSAVVKPSYSSGSGCHPGSSCGSPSSATIGSGINAVIGILPGPSGSIYDSKPVGGCNTPGCGQAISKPSIPISGIGYPSHAGSSATIHGGEPSTICGYSGCAGESPQGTYKPGVSNIPSGSIHENKPVSGCTSLGCSGQYPSGSYKPSVTGFPTFPGGSGSIHESKPVTGVTSATAAAGSNAQSNSGASQGAYKEPVNTVPNVGTGYPTFSGSSGNIHENKPITGCTSSGCSGQYPGGSYKPSTTGFPTFPGGSGSIYESKPVSGVTGATAVAGSNAGASQGVYKEPASTVPHVGTGYPTFPGGSGSIHDNKPGSSCTSSGCSGHYPNIPYKPSNSGLTTSPGTSGSIHESKPVPGLIHPAPGLIHPAPGFPSTSQPVWNKPLPGISDSIHETQPGTSPVQTGGSNINPSLPNIIGTLPGQPESIYHSKPVGTASTHANAYANANANAYANNNAGVSANSPCAGTSCTYPTGSGYKGSYNGPKCSGSSCNKQPSSIPGSFIPVTVISDGYYPSKPECSGTSCGGYSIGKAPIPTELLPPSKGIAQPHGGSGSQVTSPAGCYGSSCSSGVIVSGQTTSSGSSSISKASTAAGVYGCSGLSCPGGITASGQTTPAPSSFDAKTSEGTETGPYTSKPTFTTNNSAKPVDQDAGNLNNGVISGPGTGSIPIEESSSGSYLGLKIPGDSDDNVKPVVEITEETSKSTEPKGVVGNVQQGGAYSGSTGTSFATSSSSDSNSNTYQSGHDQFIQPVAGCTHKQCGSSSTGGNVLHGTGSDLNKANGFSTSSVNIQEGSGVHFPGPDNSKTYGTEKPGVACSSGSCGSHSIGSSGSYSGGGGSASAGASAYSSSGSSTGCLSGGCGNSGYNSADAAAGGANFGGFKAFSGAYSSANSGGYSSPNSGGYSSANSGGGSRVDLGPLGHFFGSKGGSLAKAGSYSSAGSFANSGSFASSFSSASSGSY